MDSLTTEYSFLAPTWKLPTVATRSMYSQAYGTSYEPTVPDVSPDMPLWNNTLYNSQYNPSYVPSSTIRRNYPISSNQPPTISSQQQQQNYQIPEGERPTQSGPSYYQQTNNQYGNNNIHSDNEYKSYKKSNYDQSQHQKVNRGLTYATNGQNNPPPPGQNRRVQIIDHNNHNPTNGHSFPISQQKSKSNQNRNHPEKNLFGYTGNNFNIHDFLYGDPGPDPGSYTDTFKSHQRRLQEEKLGRKSVVSDYRNFVQNGGFGPTFGSQDFPQTYTYGEKIDSEKKKKVYSKTVRQTNQHKIEGQKRVQNNNGQQKNRVVPIPKNQRAREYANKIEKPHHLKPVLQTDFSPEISIVSPILITPLSNYQRHSSLDSVLSDLSLDEFNINQSRRSSSSLSRTRRRVRFNSRDFIRRRSSTIIDLPSHIIGKSIPCPPNSLSARYHTEKSASKILDENDEHEKFNFEHFKNSLNFAFQSTSNKNEKKFINSHSMMMTKNMRLPPTATVIINQTYKPSILATTSTNNYLKKTTSNKDIKTSQRPLTARSIPSPFRNSMAISNPDFDLTIKPFHHADDENNSSNE